MDIKVTHININRNITPDLIQYSSDCIEVFTDGPVPTLEDEALIEFSVNYGTGVEFCQKNYPGVKIYLNEYNSDEE